MDAPTAGGLSTGKNDMESSHDTTSNRLNNNDSGFNEENADEDDGLRKKWGFALKDLYKLATGFFKDQEGKAFHLSYKDRLTLIAYTQQVLHGPFNTEKSPALGYLDVIGRDRRQAWAHLGSMSSKEAMTNFVRLLDSTCPLLEPFLQAHHCHLLELQRIREEEEERKRLEEEERERLRIEEEARAKEEADRQRQSEQKRLIQEALNRQTYHQFKAYAEQQYPGNPEQQALLIRQLQQQHYQQYMQQVLQQQLINNQAHHNGNNNNLNHKMSTSLDKETEDDDEEEEEAEDEENENSSGPDTSEEAETTEIPPTVAASMWTRKDVREFKDSIRKEGGDGTIKVGHGETVTVRVPTHSDGTCLFWEFATDSYDIGFGVYFEWTKNPGTQVSVHISESEDEEEDEDNEGNGDVERGGPLAAVANPDKPPVSVIIPVYRRDCHEEVYAGSHVYPGQGVYLLKFDNSYSLWRSKTLYYRVYYTR